MEDRITQKGFEFFYRHKYRTNHYSFFFTENSRKIYEKFKKDVSHELSVDFLFKYLAFQFLYWEELKLTQVSSITFSHIFGTKALQRFKERNTEYDWQLCITQLSLKLKVTRKSYYKYVGYIPYQTKFTNNRDPIKLKYHNTDRGLVTCLELTTLYNDKDTSCTTCVFAIECKELLKLNYPKIYKSRYGE